MSRFRTIAGFSLLSACGLFGGSSAPKTVDESRLARLPPEERSQLVDQQRKGDIAQSNLETAKVALQDAKQFLSIVENEDNAAKQRMTGARKSVELSTRTAGEDPAPLADAQREVAVAAQRLDTTNAKLQYAHNLVELRAAQVELRRSELNLANAQLQLARYDGLYAHNQAADLRREDFVSARDKAQADVNNRRSEVEGRRSTVQTSQGVWTELHRKFDVARQENGDNPTDAPPPPQGIN